MTKSVQTCNYITERNRSWQKAKDFLRQKKYNLQKYRKNDNYNSDCFIPCSGIRKCM